MPINVLLPIPLYSKKLYIPDVINGINVNPINKTNAGNININMYFLFPSILFIILSASLTIYH